MPKTPPVKPKQSKGSKPTTYSRPRAKSISKPHTRPAPPSTSPSLSSSDTPPALTLDKHLVLQIILAKLESSKSCDWHELSLKLSGTSGHAENEAKGGKKGTIKAKGKGRKEVAQGLTGTELREMYHNVCRWAFQKTDKGCGTGGLAANVTQSILPSLRTGRALWTDDTTHHAPVPLTPNSVSAGTPTANTSHNPDAIQEGGSEEDEAVASDHESMNETTDAKVPRGSSEIARPVRAAKARKSYVEEHEEWDDEQSDDSMGSESE